MKTAFLVFSMLFFCLKLSAQATSDTPHYFAQCMLDIPDNSVFTQLESDLRSNPYVETVRLDLVTRRAFVLTKDIASFDQEGFLSWLGDHAVAASCIQIGLHGVDQVNPYPFTNCND